MGRSNKRKRIECSEMKFTHLPPELILHIQRFIDDSSIKAFQRVNRTTRLCYAQDIRSLPERLQREILTAKRTHIGCDSEFKSRIELFKNLEKKVQLAQASYFAARHIKKLQEKIKDCSINSQLDHLFSQLVIEEYDWKRTETPFEDNQTHVEIISGTTKITIGRYKYSLKYTFVDSEGELNIPEEKGEIVNEENKVLYKYVGRTTDNYELVENFVQDAKVDFALVTEELTKHRLSKDVLKEHFLLFLLICLCPAHIVTRGPNAFVFYLLKKIEKFVDVTNILYF